MALFLHLSDLHLSGAEQAGIIGDFKSEAVPAKERLRAMTLLQGSLSQMGRRIRDEGKHLDAVIMSGDAVDRNSKEGFKEFGNLIGELEKELCVKVPVIVVPGNHDVTWGTLPSTQDRYENFLHAFRAPDSSFITPLLDGIDIDEKVTVADLSKHYLLSPDFQWVILPINSSNYCGSVEPLHSILEEEWKELLKNASSEKLRGYLTGLRKYDIARVSPQQFKGLEVVLQAIEDEVRAAGHDPDRLIRIAVIHHQLLPVSLNEEFKPFEAITNLGQLRYFLSSNKFDVVLHGHKHIGQIYWDHIYDVSKPGMSGGQVAHRVLVVSGASLASLDAVNGNEVCQLLNIQAESITPKIAIQSIKGIFPGAPLGSDEQPQFLPLKNWSSENYSTHGHMEIIMGRDANEVYEKLMAQFGESQVKMPLFNLVCHITHVAQSENLPASYPQVSGIGTGEREKWFEDLVSWWQRPESAAADSQHFTHGSRIRNYGNKEDQLERVIKVLQHDERSSRAIISLLAPHLDYVDKTQCRFPSFCSVQFMIRRAGHISFLDCTAYFRKQEIRYWWPVNVAEISRLQKNVVKRLLTTGDGLQLGTLTTVAAIASIGNSPPQVLVPNLDRALDEDRHGLWSMVYALFRGILSEEEQKMTEARWETNFSNLIPAEDVNPDGVPVSIAGVKFVLEQVKLFASHHNNELHKDLIEHLDALLRANRNYLKNVQDNEATQVEHQNWRDTVKIAVKNILRDVRDIFAASLN